GAAHSLVNLAMNGDRSRFIENDCGRLFVLAIPTEVETLRFRIGKDVVISVVHVRELHRCPDQDRQQVRRERDVLLRYLSRRLGGTGLGGTKITFQINYRCRRIGPGQRHVRAGVVTLIKAAIVRRFRQLDAAFNNYLGLHGTNRETDRQKENGACVAQSSSGNSEKGATPNPQSERVCSDGALSDRKSVV